MTFRGAHSDHSKYYNQMVRQCSFPCALQLGPKHSKVTSMYGVQRAVGCQEWERSTLLGLPTQPQDKASGAPFIIEIDFSPTCITKIDPSYFELEMCRSTKKNTISIQQQGQSKVLMLRNVNCFILNSVRINNGSAVCTKLPPAISALSAVLFGRRLKSHIQDLPLHKPITGLFLFWFYRSN